MPINRTRATQVIKSFDFKNLFIEEMGWNNPSNRQPLPVQVDGQIYALQPLAEKAGMVVLNCALPTVPDRTTRRKLDREVTKRHYEHLIVFSNPAKTTQVWQWVRREPGKPEACRDYTFYKNNPSSIEGLLQKLDTISFSLSEEEELNTVAVASRVKKGFDVETVTKKFYERFDKERRAFLTFIQGIPNQASREWYASLMLNRLMFVYFIQKKGFLASDPDYLRNRLKKVQAQQGKGKFHSFYREFLLVLFHEGLGAQKRDPQLLQLLGQVPYLNGGLFDVHELERTNSAIEIPDEAFEGVFNFFDAYQWHLDERPLRRNDEINPDVLGYIFEKYINQKQMGAYYTKEDITEYISKNTILPYLFDKAQDDCEIAFKPDGTVWRLLQTDPDRYIYPAVKKGVELPFPAEIEAGVNDVSRREGWNRPAPENYALPTEIWREVVARRKRYTEVKTKLSAGEITSVNDLITYNLDIRQFAQDVIENSEGSNLLEAFYSAITRVTVLDPTCGSGAFLFAALNILEPLYEACLERMKDFIGEADAAGKPNPAKYASLRKTLQEVARHPNRRYFIYRSIILQNLYGVDIMEEAVEIAKLRLFLKLAAQVECDQSKPNFGLEPLPDIDFNIRAGNTLVGFATQAETNAAIDRKFDFDGAKDRINQKAKAVARGYQSFRDLQNSFDLTGVDLYAAKQSLRTELDALRTELDRYLAGEYGITTDQEPKTYPVRLAQWRQSHQPFHWWVEFYGIMQDGGFDVIIGNPPYAELRSITTYSIKNLKTLSTKNLYSLVMERCIHFSLREGRLGFIVPVSSISTEGYSTLQDIIFNNPIHISSFDDRPAKLFEGLEHIRLSIHLIENRVIKNNQLYASEYLRWNTLERSQVFARLEYQPVKLGYLPYCLPKMSRTIELSILNKIWGDKKSIGEQQAPSGSHQVFYSRKVQNFLQALDFVPEVYDGHGNLRPPSEFKELKFSDKHKAGLTFCLLNSTLFLWFIAVLSDCRHLNRREVEGFHLDLDKALKDNTELWQELALKLSENLRITSEYRQMKFKHDTLRVQCIIPKYSKPIIDKIDRALAKHYSFTDEELDFIINYNIKYRMGPDSEEGEE